MKYDINEFLDQKISSDLANARAIGIDIGSRAAKAVLLYDGFLYTAIQPSRVSSIATSKELISKLSKEAGIDDADIEYIVGTGYGRVAMDFGDTPFRGLTEITCHALGAHYMDSETRTIVDIGGQDSKAIKVNAENGMCLTLL